MQELDEVWAGMLENALAKAEAENRRDVADYLTLKAMNDAIRQTSVHWLFGLLLEIAATNPQIAIENENPHRFNFSNASLVGSLLRLRRGVRCLTVEAGWTRTPKDGFMRGGALAAARITHFGMAKYNTDLLLIQLNGTPVWFFLEKDGRRVSFDSSHLHQHFQIFLGEN
jgi:hypothetical protein